MCGAEELGGLRGPLYWVRPQSGSSPAERDAADELYPEEVYYTAMWNSLPAARQAEMETAVQTYKVHLSESGLSEKEIERCVWFYYT